MSSDNTSAGPSRGGFWPKHSSQIFLGIICSIVASIMVAVWNKAYARSTLGLLLAGVVLLSVAGSTILLNALTKNQKRLQDEFVASLREAAPSRPPAESAPSVAGSADIAPAVYAINRPALLIGLDVGRSRLTIGTLRSDRPMGFGLPGHSVFDDPRRVEGMTLGPGIYNELVGHVSDTVRNWDHLDGVGIGLPGEIDAVAGVVVSSPGGLAGHEQFIEHLAAKMARDRKLVQLLVDDPKHPEEQLCREVAQKIRIDNDANCAARGVLNRHREEPGWRNFACVIVGTGVGAGLVLDRRVYYGSCGVAGEIGHTICQLQPSPLTTTMGTGSWSPQSCACGREATTTHWEPIVSGRALARMMQQLTPALYNALQEHLGQEPGGHHLYELVRADGYGASSTPDYEVYRNVLRDSDLRPSVYGLLDAHADYVAIGLANLVNVLNLDHVVLGGGVLDGLMSLVRYRTRVNRSLRGHLFETADRALLDIVPSIRQSAWQGAALLFLDASYKAHRDVVQHV